MLDNSNPEVQKLQAGQTITEFVYYTVKDADGDESTAKLLIAIHGKNDPEEPDNDEILHAWPGIMAHEDEALALPADRAF